MLTMDEQKNQNADVHNCSIDGVMNDQNTNLDDVLLGKRVKIARKENCSGRSRDTQEEPHSTPGSISGLFLRGIRQMER